MTSILVAVICFKNFDNTLRNCVLALPSNVIWHESFMLSRYILTILLNIYSETRFRGDFLLNKVERN